MTGSLAPPSQILLRRLAERPWAADAYLAGSAALALYLGHRPVRDLDLMTHTNRLAAQERRDVLADLLALDLRARVESARDGYLFARCGENVGLKLFYYPYPLVEPEEEIFGLRVASPVDLGLMKLAAIISRGDKRDFVDLYLLAERLALGQILERAGEKFGHVGDFPLQALKALADVGSAEGEPMPRLGRPLAWQEVAAWAAGEVRTRGRRHVGLGDHL